MPPKDANIIVPGSCECYLYDKRGIADVTTRCAHCSHKSPHKRETVELESETKDDPRMEAERGLSTLHKALMMGRTMSQAMKQGKGFCSLGS
jgi:hypothetical protein